MTIQVLEVDLDEMGELADGMLLADGFEDAFLGFARRFGWYEPVAVYDYTRCLQILMERDGMDLLGASEFFEFNVIGAWVGDSTPIFILGAKLENVHDYFQMHQHDPEKAEQP